jgi:predicted metal-dependent hydrolase
MSLISLFDSAVETKPKVTPAECVHIQHKQFEIEVNGSNVPVRICFEARYNNRVSVNKNGILIRISKHASAEEQKKHIQTFLSWAKNKLGEKPDLLDYLPQRKYFDGEALKVGDYVFVVHIIYNKLHKSTARIHENHILLSLASGLNKEAEQNAASYLVSKCLAKFFQPIVSQRLHELNQKHFGKRVASVKLKYNTSNWGSCSSHGNINISVRLMFAPQDVIDYVLIHELAHLVHHNHSQRFWDLVESIMPNYREKERHLEENNFRYYL